MNGNDIGGAGTVSGTTGDFTNLKATGLTLNNRTGTSAPKDEYDIWVANAKSAESAKSVKASDITGKITKDMLETAVQTTLNNVGTGGGKVYLPGQTAPKGTYTIFLKVSIWNGSLGTDSTGGANMSAIVPSPDDWKPTANTAVPSKFNAAVGYGHGRVDAYSTAYVISK